MDGGSGELIALYRPWWLQTLITIVLVALPVWGLILLGSAVGMAVALARGNWFGVCVSIVWSLPCLVATFASWWLPSQKLHLTQSGIRFPSILAPFLAFRTVYRWSEIESIWLNQDSHHTGVECVLKFKVVNGTSKSRILEIDLGAIADEFRRLSLIEALYSYAPATDEFGRKSLIEALNRYAPALRKDCLLDRLLEKHSHPRLLGPRSLWGSEDASGSDKQLTLTYSLWCQRLGLFLAFLMFPLWGVAGAFGTIAMFIGFFVSPLSALILLVFPLFLILGIVVLACLFDTKLTVGETGISFPLFMAGRLGFRRERTWSEITGIKYSRAGSRPPLPFGRAVAPGDRPLEHGTIYIQVGPRLTVPIALESLEEAHLQKLLLAISVWGQRIEQDIEIRQLHEKLANQKLGKSEVTYTQLWEDEMNRRFSSTNFVPLEPKHSLRSGTLAVVKQLAFGGLSAVYLAQLRQTELVVLKEFVVPDADETLQAKARQLFEREASILMKLSHPRLAHVRDCFVEEGRTYLLLDYIPGTDLRQIVLQKGKQSEETVLAWAKQIAEVVEYLHCQIPPVIHRDLTPDNILLTADDQIKLIDFGAANEFVGTATGTLVGKQSFIAPEQFRGDTVPQSDIYSLGATLSYLLTGEEPQPLSQSLPKKVNAQLSEFTNRLVADCTAFEVADRIQSVAEFSGRLSGYKAHMVGSE